MKTSVRPGWLPKGYEYEPILNLVCSYCGARATRVIICPAGSLHSPSLCNTESCERMAKENIEQEVAI